jgi:MYXO-CTERM domain-containing protein
MEADVKTLDEGLFAKLDRLTAPRLVEYFEMDPCAKDGLNGVTNGGGVTNGSANGGVNVEAEFKVGEYEIVILSSEESTALESWLTENNYNVPAGAAPYYEPYIQSGMYFFVAKVDPAEVEFGSEGQAILSPLRFAYESDDFALPIRLGMINSAGQQDLIIHILARDQRYDVANYDNVTIPTNKEVTPETKDNFGEFYKALFAETIEQHPGAVVTEYAWQASNCDPCPGPVIDPSDLTTLGADVVSDPVMGGSTNGATNGPDGPALAYDQSWVVTRLHARYGKDEIGEDLVFQEAEPIVGGREFVTGSNGELEQGAQPSNINNFQGRYIIRHPFQGEIDCENPYFGSWGSPQALSAPGPTSTGDDIAPNEDLNLPDHLVDDVSELGIDGEGQREAGSTPSGSPNNNAGPAGDEDDGGGNMEGGGGCGGCATGTPAPTGMLILLLAGLVVRRRNRA